MLTLILYIVLIIIGPVLTIFSINHVTHQEWLNLDLPTWAAVTWLLMMLFGRSKN